MFMVCRMITPITSILDETRGFKGGDVYDVNDVYTDNINQRIRAVPSQMMCTV